MEEFPYFLHSCINREGYVHGCIPDISVLGDHTSNAQDMRSVEHVFGTRSGFVTLALKDCENFKGCRNILSW